MSNLEEQISVEKEAYLGSVRFFKHLFLALLLVIIIVPSAISVVLGIQLSEVKKVERELRQEMEAADAETQTRPITLTQVTTEKGEYINLPYMELYPEFYAPTVDYSSISKEKVCYLTFDDGPSERTDEVLDVLKQKNVKATFFVTKQDTNANRARLKRIVEEGHTLGMHTATHEYSLIYASVEDFLTDYYELYKWIVEVTGEAPTIFRFPGGSVNGYNRSIYQEIIAEMTRRGFVYFDWNVSSGDMTSSPLPAGKITENCLNDAHKLQCAVVLLHDSVTKNTTVDALPEIISRFQESGFTVEKLTPEVTPVIFSYPD